MRAVRQAERRGFASAFALPSPRLALQKRFYRAIKKASSKQGRSRLALLRLQGRNSLHGGKHDLLAVGRPGRTAGLPVGRNAGKQLGRLAAGELEEVELRGAVALGLRRHEYAIAGTPQAIVASELSISGWAVLGR